MTAARRTPLIGAVPKMLLPILVILPGMIALSLASIHKGGYHLPQQTIADARLSGTLAAVRAATKYAPTLAAFEKDANPTKALDPQAADALKAISKAADASFHPAKLAAVVINQAAQPLPNDKLETRLRSATENDYDRVILSLVQRYCPPGLLGLALTALLASFMSGMAGNVTAFNTVWTYDLYQAYIAPNRSDAHYMWMGRVITVVGVLLSIACAYFARNYNNAMDIIQLVFGFVNAPLFATFLLGMFWSRATSHGAFFGLLGGMSISALFHAFTVAAGNLPGIKGGYLGVKAKFPSEMAQNFWLASFAFIGCFTLTVAISIATRRTKSDEELKGLVYSLTPKVSDGEQSWFVRPAFLGIVLLIACAVLNYIFW
jgi:SSS family solute:Na+ symporter